MGSTIEQISAMKESTSYHLFPTKRLLSRDEDADLWFPDASMEYPFGGEAPQIAISEPENLENLLMMVDSMDADESLKPGIYAAESFNDSQDLQEQGKIPLTPIHRYTERPSTPPTIKPSFNELPPIISPDLCLEIHSKYSSLIDEAFQPPKRPCPKVARGRKIPRLPSPRRVPTPHEQSLLNKLVQSMSRSHASRREILRRRHFFGNHPSLYEFERLDDSQRQIWSFIASQHVHSK